MDNDNLNQTNTSGFGGAVPPIPQNEPNAVQQVTTQPESIQSSVQAETKPEAQPETTQTTTQTDATAQPEPEKKKSKGKVIGITIASLVLVASLFAAGVIFVPQLIKNNSSDGSGESSKEDESTEPTTGTITGDVTSGSVTATINKRSISYSGAYVIDGTDVTISGGTYESTSDNEAVFLVINGGTLNIDGATINKSGSEDFQGRGDDYSFYGINSAIVVIGEGSSVNVNNTTVNTSVSGANAVVATNGGKVVFANSEINTTKDNSRGLHATFGGYIDADTVKISTQGGSCAALATDRGAGTVVAKNMTLSTAGAGSPLIYSTGSITVSNSTGTATGAQIAVVEGKNSINLDGCDFSANGIGNRNNVDNAGVMIYQSMSGDASMGTGLFVATNSTLTLLDTSSVYGSAPFFFITNTDAVINLDGSTISFNPDGVFVSAISTSEWGREGSNGGKVSISINNTTTSNLNTNVDDISSITGLNTTSEEIETTE